MNGTRSSKRLAVMQERTNKLHLITEKGNQCPNNVHIDKTAVKTGKQKFNKCDKENLKQSINNSSSKSKNVTQTENFRNHSVKTSAKQPIVSKSILLPEGTKESLKVKCCDTDENFKHIPRHFSRSNESCKKKSCEQEVALTSKGQSNLNQLQAPVSDPVNEFKTVNQSKVPIWAKNRSDLNKEQTHSSLSDVYDITKDEDLIHDNIVVKKKAKKRCKVKCVAAKVKIKTGSKIVLSKRNSHSELKDKVQVKGKADTHKDDINEKSHDMLVLGVSGNVHTLCEYPVLPEADVSKQIKTINCERTQSFHEAVHSNDSFQTLHELDAKNSPIDKNTSKISDIHTLDLAYIADTLPESNINVCGNNYDDFEMIVNSVVENSKRNSLTECSYDNDKSISVLSRFTLMGKSDSYVGPHAICAQEHFDCSLPSSIMASPNSSEWETVCITNTNVPSYKSDLKKFHCPSKKNKPVNDNPNVVDLSVSSVWETLSSVEDLSNNDDVNNREMDCKSPKRKVQKMESVKNTQTLVECLLPKMTSTPGKRLPSGGSVPLMSKNLATQMIEVSAIPAIGPDLTECEISDSDIVSPEKPKEKYSPFPLFQSPVKDVRKTRAHKIKKPCLKQKLFEDVKADKADMGKPQKKNRKIKNDGFKDKKKKIVSDHIKGTLLTDDESFCIESRVNQNAVQSGNSSDLVAKELDNSFDSTSFTVLKSRKSYSSKAVCKKIPKTYASKPPTKQTKRDVFFENLNAHFTEIEEMDLCIE